MTHSTDEEIAQVIQRLSWSLDDLVVILFSTSGIPTIFMDRGFRFYKANAMQSPFRLDLPITAKVINGWVKGPHEIVHAIVVQDFISQDDALFELDDD